MEVKKEVIVVLVSALAGFGFNPILVGSQKRRDLNDEKVTKELMFQSYFSWKSKKKKKFAQ